VVLKAIATWGLERAVSRFNGIFALICYDTVDHQLLVARDRYGVKPLYVGYTPNSVLFASEIKAFTAHPDFSMRLDPEGLVEYLTFQNFITDRTLYRDVCMFPAGHCAAIDTGGNGRVKSKEYWDFRFGHRGDHGSQKGMQEELLYLFEQAVSRQLVSDVDVSSYLSGGMDSASITAVASRQLKHLRTFTCGFDLRSASGVELNFDERELAEYMSYLFQTEHYEVVLKSGDMERSVRDIAWHLDEPRVGQSYPNYYVAGLASRFSKVVLGGTGGDELFGGYPWRYYHAAGSQNLDEFIDNYLGFWQRMFHQDDMPEILAPIWDQVKDVSARDLFKGVLEKHPVDFADPAASLDLSLYFETKTFLHGLLVVEDKLSMAHSMESRVPFLDNDLVDFAVTLPASSRVRDLHKVAKMNRQQKNAGTEAIRQFQKTNDGKILLREMMAKLLPSEIVEAQKQGFSAPDASWFRGESIDYVKRTLNKGDAPIFRFLDKKAVDKRLDLHFDGKENKRLMIWSLLSLNEVMDLHDLTV
jgi:asparagine synthase (glutamine-hydrolysing)